ncbi:hypothetical protein T265_00218 [Opisthorchis viverrini]|uniref:Endonuclease/exonuclease/phosphatase domain-containing protein n=1 Tax=Opisthorchis viverrini TaxID=6198 RepID=A0A075A3T7_OPIVI|nr:hypothetical protein T265_00218 [Opisthorchis viverrini]KER34031.1 hypothetical protein T265_00218 [Opisthorchis viverrini]
MNVRSLLPKRDDLRQWVSDVNPDILGVAETWLDLTVLDQEIKLPGYEHFRCDRQQRLHGGVLLYVKSDIRCRLQNTYLSNDCYCEQIWCEIITTKGNFHVGVLYRSPANISSDWITRAQNNLCAQNVLLMGDFNFPHWFIIPITVMRDKCIVVADCHGFIESAFGAFELQSHEFLVITGFESEVCKAYAKKLGLKLPVSINSEIGQNSLIATVLRGTLGLSSMDRSRSTSKQALLAEREILGVRLAAGVLRQTPRRRASTLFPTLCVVVRKEFSENPSRLAYNAHDKANETYGIR